MKNEIITITLSFLLAFSVGATSALATPSQSEVKKAQQEFEQLAQQLSEADANLQAQTDAVEKTSYQIEQKQGEIDKLNQELEQRRNVLAGRMRSAYKHGKSDIFNVFLGSTDIEQLVSRIYYLDKISAEDEKSIDEVTSLEQKLKEEKVSLEKTKSSQDEKARAIAQQAKAYEAKAKQAQDYYNKLDGELKEEIKKQAEAKAKAETEELQIKQQQTNKAVANNSSSNAINDIIKPTKPSKPSVKPSEPSGGGLTTAYSCIGKPYVSGAVGPNSFDCSGLVCYCYGYKRGRTTGAMISSLKASGDWKNSASELNVGDLVFTGYGHVGIYVGNYRFIHSPRPGRVVCEQTMWSCIGGGRY